MTTGNAMMWVAGMLGGIVLWTLLEYVLHRFVFHGRALGRTLAKEHIQHHAAVDYFAPALRKAAYALPVLAVICTLAALPLGVALGTSVPFGVATGWLIYEVIHRRIHTHAPLGRYGAWARRHHLLHHFGRADSNHGVTSPVWDVVFGTLAERQTIRVPRRHASKFPWLVRADGETSRIAPAYESDYQLA